MSEQSGGQGWWQAANGLWYPPGDAPPAPGWWLASDGRWYPPEGWWLASDGNWYPPSEAPTGEEALATAAVAAGGAPTSASAASQSTGPPAAPPGAPEPNRSRPAPWDRWRSGVAASAPAGAAWEEEQSARTVPAAVGEAASGGSEQRRLRQGLRLPRILSVVLVVVLVGAGAYVGYRHWKGTSPPPAPTMNKAVASGAFASLWPRLVGDLRHRDAAGLRAIMPAGMSALIAGNLAKESGGAKVAYRSLELTAPPEHAYPLSFLAEVDQRWHGRPVSFLLVVERSGPTSPWQVADLTGRLGGRRWLPPTSPSRMTRAAPAGSLSADMAGFADFLRGWAETGRPPPSNLWNSRARSLRSPLLLLALPWALVYRGTPGYSHRSNFTVVSSSPIFAGPAATSVQCALVEGRMTLTRPHGGAISEQATGPFAGLPPGKYRLVRESSTMDVCISATTTAHLVSLSAGRMRASGVRAK